MKKIIRVIILSVFIILGLCGCGKTSVELDGYMTYSVDGYNGTGKLNYNFDWDSLKSTLMDFEDPEFAQKFEALKQNLIFNINKGEGLYNGDLVVIKASYSEGIQSLFKKYKFEYKDISIPVTGLPDLTYIDIFEKVEVTFRGISPNVTAELKAEMPEGFELGNEFTVEPESGLSVGDRVKVTYVGSLDELLASGYQAETLTKEYTVEECNVYVTNGEQVDGTYLDTTSAVASENAKSFVINNYIDIMKKEYKIITNEGELDEEGNTPEGYTNFIGTDALSYAKSCKSLDVQISGAYLNCLNETSDTSENLPINELCCLYEFTYNDEILGKGSFYVPVFFTNGVVYTDTGVDFPLNTISITEESISFNKVDIMNALSKEGYTLTELTQKMNIKD